MGNSKDHWLQIRKNLDVHEIRLGMSTAESYVEDPKMLGFVASRYKFVSKLIAGTETALEVGCCDAFGVPIVAQTVGHLICTDIDEEMIADDQIRMKHLSNTEFRYFDFRESRYDKSVDAIYSVDVIEHIFPEEEDRWIANQVASLTPRGVMVIGTPNVTANQYASPHSQAGHINLKDHKALREIGLKFFHNVFMFSMNDEVVHTGFSPMAHYLWALCVGPRG